MITGRAYSRRFFELQARFAIAAASLLSRALPDALLNYTAFYRILGLDWSFDPHDATWQSLLTECVIDNGPAFISDEEREESIQRIAESAYQLYLARYDLIPQATPGPRWGCFAYERMENEAGALSLHLHFGSHDASERAMGIGPLSHERIPARMAELRAMFAHIQATEPEITETTPVLGSSWLYSRPSYLRLFPPEYAASSRPIEPHFRARSVWGQFLRYDWQVNERTAQEFLRRLSEVSQRIEDVRTQRDESTDNEAAIQQERRLLAGCFPAQTLAKVAPIGVFYAFYGLN